jgi:hypothetical protein
MAMGTRRQRQRQERLWYRRDLAEAPRHPFYRRLNQVLEQAGFDEFCEARCRHGRSRTPWHIKSLLCCAYLGYQNNFRPSPLVISCYLAPDAESGPMQLNRKLLTDKPGLEAGC